MAWYVNRPNGHRWIQFIDAGRKQQTIRLGKASVKIAREWKDKVELIANSGFSKVNPEPEIAKWLGEIALHLHAKLAAVGLVASREAANRMTLKAWLTFYLY